MMNGESNITDISKWDARLKEQLERSFHNYQVHTIDLSVARDKQKFDWTGETIIVEKASSATAIATVRLMFDDADELILEKNVEIKSIFNKVYLSNEVQAGEWLNIIVGINFEYKKKIDEEIAGGGLPKTGQIISYEDFDDGYYQNGLDHDYEQKTLEGDIVVIDNSTGLMWAADGDAAGCNNGVTITWSNALIYCNGLTFAGFSDWSLPNIKELFSLLEFDEGLVGLQQIKQPPFSNTKNFNWTSTTYPSGITTAIMIQFNYITFMNQTKTNSFNIRACRLMV